MFFYGPGDCAKRKYRRDIVLVRYDQAAIRMAEILQSKLLGTGITQSSDRMTPRMESDFQEAEASRLVLPLRESSMSI
jgi:hypothetical protein